MSYCKFECSALLPQPLPLGWCKHYRVPCVLKNIFFTKVLDPGNGIFESATEKIVRPRHRVCDRIQAFRDSQSETKGLALKISLIPCTLKFALEMNALTLIPRAPDCFNLDVTSSKHIGRQVLNVLWQCARELWSVHPGTIFIWEVHIGASQSVQKIFFWFLMHTDEAELLHMPGHWQ